MNAQRRNPKRERQLDSRKRASWTSASMALATRECHERVLAILASLDQQDRDLIRMIRREGLRYAEAGERLGISERNAGVRLVRALRTLRHRCADTTFEVLW